MSTAVFVNTYAYSVTYVSNKLLTQMIDIIRLSGLDPASLARDWSCLERGLSTWLRTEHLEQVVLEVFNPRTGLLIHRWDLEMYYNVAGDGSFWVDPDSIRYHIAKQSVPPSTCNYRVVAVTKPGRPDVAGWSDTTLLATEGFVKQSIGTTISGGGLSTGASYWRKGTP